MLITVTLKDKHQQTLVGLLTDTTAAVPNANIKPTRPKLGWWGIFKNILDWMSHQMSGRALTMVILIIVVPGSAIVLR
ncbi:hypothetical protein [Rahnella bonaserana]|uniref:hypothetical protein n=1 Tax=Rahnella bonaserana TaxID=2816248 RepID=UPI00320A3A99